MDHRPDRRHQEFRAGCAGVGQPDRATGRRRATRRSDQRARTAAPMVGRQRRRRFRGGRRYPGSSALGFLSGTTGFGQLVVLQPVRLGPTRSAGPLRRADRCGVAGTRLRRLPVLLPGGRRGRRHRRRAGGVGMGSGAAGHPGARSGRYVHQPRRQRRAARRQRGGDQRPAARPDIEQACRRAAAVNYLTDLATLLWSKIQSIRTAPTNEAADMTNTVAPTNGSHKGGQDGPKPRSRRAGRKTAVGEYKHKRTGIDVALGLLTPIVGQEFLDKYNLRDPLNRTLRYGVKTMFSTAGATTRQFKRVQGLRGGPTRLKASGKDYYDLTPDDDQKLIVETVDEFAEEILRPAAHDADEATTYPPDLLAKAAELGITAVNVPEDFDGIAEHRSSVTNVLVAEALAYGDMGLALPILAPGGVASALTHWGSADQQATYLQEFAGENVPQACLAIAEPRPLFDPTALKTTAVRTPGGYRLDGVKSLVPAAADAELFIVGAQLNGKPALFIVESSAKGLTVKADPSMGIRAAALGQVELSGVSVPLNARLGEDEATDDDYSESIALSRLGWAALAVGTSHAVLDYVIPYVKDREAFGEPVARRQAVAFMCANIAIELDGLRLITWRGAARAEQGLTITREAALAKRLGTDKGMQIGLDGVQLLGGHGYTKEHPVERWYRDLRAIGVAEGVVVI